MRDGKKWTEFFSDAIEMYGKRLTRCLVDRDFGKEEYDAQRRNRDA
jgi:alkyl sulfatase BDS1-like metallo-beta-lactamase superfamily hydrolase